MDDIDDDGDVDECCSVTSSDYRALSVVSGGDCRSQASAASSSGLYAGVKGLFNNRSGGGSGGRRCCSIGGAG